MIFNFQNISIVFIENAFKHSQSGQASDIEITAKQILMLKQELYEIIAKHSGQSFVLTWGRKFLSFVATRQ